jgi:hypothetical protein
MIKFKLADFNKSQHHLAQCHIFHNCARIFVLETIPPPHSPLGVRISDNVIWKKIYEKRERTRGRTREKVSTIRTVC